MANIFFEMFEDLGKAIDSALEDISTPQCAYKNDLYQERREAELDGMKIALVWVKDMLDCDYPQEFEEIAKSLWQRRSRQDEKDQNCSA